MRSSNKNVVLTQRYPKHAVLKMPISHSNSYMNSTFAQHIFIDLATFHYNLTPHPLSLLLHTSKLPQISAIFSLFGSALVNPFFLLAQKYPFFNPRTRRILELQTCKQGFCDLTDSVDSSDTLSFARYPKIKSYRSGPQHVVSLNDSCWVVESLDTILKHLLNSNSSINSLEFYFIFK